jgi:hypothetical protein
MADRKERKREREGKPSLQLMCLWGTSKIPTIKDSVLSSFQIKRKET